MRLNSEGLRELYERETSRAARGSAADCFTEDLLTRAAAGELSQSERENTADHLASCSDCAKEFQAIRSLKPWVEKVSANTRTQVIPLTIAENGHATAAGPMMHDAQIGSRRVSFYLPYAVAAAALVLSFALAALLISKSRENQRLIAEINNQKPIAADKQTAEALAESRRLLEETNRRVEQESAARRAAEEQLAKRNATEKSSAGTRPRSDRGGQNVAPDVNVPIIDLSPHDAGRGEQNPQPAAIQLSPDTDLFTLILNLGGEDTSSSYSLEVTDRGNKTIWVSRNLRKSPYNNFTVAMHRRSFPPGEYRLKIYGLRNGRRELVEEYAIRLAY
jgi:hypothetical protein